MNSYPPQSSDANRSDVFAALKRVRTGVGLPHDKQPGPTARPSRPASDSVISLPLPENEAARLARQLPDGWNSFVHPSGYLYFRHKECNVTTSVQPPHFVDEQIATQQVQKLVDSCRQHNWELVAYLVDGDRVDYLVVDHQARRVMTPVKVKSKLETYRAKLQSQPEAQTAQNGLGLSNIEVLVVKPTTRLDHLEEYWAHVAQYPNHVVLDNESGYKAHDALMYCYSDRALFKRSNATWSLEDTKELLSIYDRLRMTGRRDALWTWFVACVLRASINDKIWSQWGQPDALMRRREHDDSIYGHGGPHHKLGTAMNILYYIGGSIFLGVHSSYLRRIEAVNRPEGVNTVRWRAFLAALVTEWRDCNLLGTVLIAATVSLLAAPNLSDISQIFCLVSIVLAIGCVLIGVFFLWFHMPHSHSSGDTGLFYFEHATGSPDSMLPLAISLSTPVVLLAWSFISFILAVVTYAWVVPAVKGQVADVVEDAQSHLASTKSPILWSMVGIVVATMMVCGLAWLFLPRGFATRVTSQGPRAPASTVVKWSASRIWAASKRKTSLHSKKEQSKDEEERVSMLHGSSRRPSFTGSTAPQDAHPTPHTQNHPLEPATTDLPVDNRRLGHFKISFADVPMPDTMVHHPTGKTPPHHQRGRSDTAGGSLLRSSSSMPPSSRISASRPTTPRLGPADDDFPADFVTVEGAPPQTRTDTEDTVRATVTSQPTSGSTSAPAPELRHVDTGRSSSSTPSSEPSPLGLPAQQVAVHTHEEQISLLFESPSLESRLLPMDVGLRPPDVRVHLSDDEGSSRYGSPPPEQYTSSSASSALALGMTLGVHAASTSPPPITTENSRAMALDALLLALQTALNEFRDTTARER